MLLAGVLVGSAIWDCDRESPLAQSNYPTHGKGIITKRFVCTVVSGQSASVRLCVSEQTFRPLVTVASALPAQNKDCCFLVSSGVAGRPSSVQQDTSRDGECQTPVIPTCWNVDTVAGAPAATLKLQVTAGVKATCSGATRRKKPGP